MDQEAQAMARGEEVELRGPSPREVIDVIDAISFGEGKTRMQIVNQVLADYVQKQIHRSSLVCKAAGVIPPPSPVLRNTPSPYSKVSQSVNLGLDEER